VAAIGKNVGVLEEKLKEAKESQRASPAAAAAAEADVDKFVETIEPFLARCKVGILLSP